MAQGKRAGARPKRRARPVLLGLALGVTAAVVAWGYLVWAAIDFGTTARSGDDAAWGFLALAALGAVLCLFLGLILLARVGRELGLTRSPAASTTSTASAATTAQDGTAPPATPGGRRAAR